MEFKYQDNRIIVSDANHHWLGDVSFPYVDKEANRVVVERVFVVPSARHQGLGDQLMQKFISVARNRNLNRNLVVKIMCPFAKKYFKLHHDVQDLLLPQDRFK